MICSLQLVRVREVVRVAGKLPELRLGGARQLSLPPPPPAALQCCSDTLPLVLQPAATHTTVVRTPEMRN